MGSDGRFGQAELSRDIRVVHAVDEQTQDAPFGFSDVVVRRLPESCSRNALGIHRFAGQRPLDHIRKLLGTAVLIPEAFYAAAAGAFESVVFHSRGHDHDLDLRTAALDNGRGVQPVFMILRADIHEDQIDRVSLAENLGGSRVAEGACEGAPSV